MKKVIILSFAAFAITLGACNNTATKTEEKNQPQQSSIDTAKLKSGDEFYQCEMHHEVTSAQPGSCPKCGMYLKKIVKQ